jgi:hypothetical protein
MPNFISSAELMPNYAFVSTPQYVAGKYINFIQAAAKYTKMCLFSSGSLIFSKKREVYKN